jgi:hypothetical protein
MLGLKAITTKLDVAFKAKNFTLLASYGAVENEEGDWEYHLSGDQLPQGLIHIPLLLLWTSKKPRQA